ncbi:spore germination protein KA [Anaerosolibacter carboniphilus]|uniref:Spore germination protein KA n=1 Tax=Anaerosolibacter carboniphilus TaxID=1417629 RepID=A0A841KVF2_9FIRM|nr:spore germination protein [Anaerosolibacter carboniphilus]MBB6214165.1 spore germination protein KA [Anaerosolibacter carboniphilus]
MLRNIFKKLKKLADGKRSNKKGEHLVEDIPISTNLTRNIQQLKEIFDNCSDIVFREYTIGGTNPVKAAIIYVDGLVNTSLISDGALNPLMVDSLWIDEVGKVNSRNAYKLVKDRLLTIGGIIETNQIHALADHIMTGTAALLLDGSRQALILNAKSWESRAVAEPETEAVVRGPRDGFTENIRVNTAHIRRRIRTSRLKSEAMKIGALTKTDVLILYIKDIADDKVVEEVRTRLSRIDTDSILESGYIEEFIEDEPFTPFAQMNVTERPDKVAASLLEGQVAIMVDNTPFVLLVPYTFPQFLGSPEDHYNRYPWSTFVRLLRIIALIIAMLGPSVYVAITSFHQEMIPTSLLISIARSREGIPFPAFVEAVLMEATFEILREAGVRLPRPVGTAISFVGALVIGEAAVTAKLVSPIMVVIVALTAIASFTIPSMEGSIAVRLVRFPIIFLAGALGLFGIMVALLAILIHLCALRSFGVPFLSPLAPLSSRDLKDSFVRFPWWAMFTRPRMIGSKDPVRQGFFQKPQTPSPGKKGSGKDGGKDA